MGKASRFGVTQLPALIWLKNYDLSSLRADMMAAVIVSIMLIPQSNGRPKAEQKEHGTYLRHKNGVETIVCVTFGAPWAAKAKAIVISQSKFS